MASGALLGIAVAAAALVTASSQLASANEGTTSVDPTTLPRGARPQVPYLRTDTGVIHDGARAVRVTIPGDLRFFADARDGYVLSGYPDARKRHWLAVYHTDGHRRVLARAYDEIWNVTVAPGGGRVAYSVGGTNPTRIVIRRLSDGAVLARRSFRRETRIVAFGTHRLLLAQGRSNFDTVTRWWRPGRTKLGVYANTGRARAADLSAHQVEMAYSGSNTRMESIPRGAEPAWKVPQWWEMPGWSPDDRRIFFVSGLEDVDAWAYQQLDVVGRRGRELHRFTGWFAGVLEDTHALVWEDNRTFLVDAYTLGSDATLGRGAVVRCHVGGSCERASAVFDVGGVRSLPYWLAPRV
jgi:hypothetical protein